MTHDPGLICRECKGEHLDKPNYSCEERWALNPPLLSSNRSRVLCRGRFAVQNEFESHIKSFEEKALEHCLAAIQGMKEVRYSNWFQRLLQSRIVPALRRIGYDESFTWTLFRMAAPAWELMGPITDKGTWFHPALSKDIEEIRRGTLEKAKRNFECVSLLAEVHPQALRFRMQAGMGPRDIFSLLEDVCTSWIILPRVYDHLHEHHALCLLNYLKYLESETNAEFRKVLARITVEFVGNYTQKHISKIYSRNSMVDGLFWGYAALFWRNLRKPPVGFEEAQIFVNFLHWAKTFRNRSTSVSRKMVWMIENMEEALEKAFPSVNAFGLASAGSNEVDRFLITLRHGHPGIDAVARYFGIGGSLLKHATDGRLSYASVPTALSALFRELKRSYPMETSMTQESIRHFLSKLRADYELKAMEMAQAGYELSEQLRFVGPRVLGMVNDFTGVVS